MSEVMISQRRPLSRHVVTAEEIRRVMGIVFPEAVTLVREARQGLQ